MSEKTGQAAAENKMGVMPVNRLLITMSVPMMISMLVQALYNIVDSMFVARLSEDALTAVSLAFPIQNLMISVGVGTGVGVNALVSRSLGEKNTETANSAANNGLRLAFFSFLAFAVLTLLFGHAFFAMQTDNEVILNYGVDYIRVIGILSFGVFGQIIFERLLQSTGKTFYTMITQSLGAIINIIMDPILIFGLFGFPRLEVTGAALATVFGQLVASGLGLYFNRKKNTELSINLKKYRIAGRTIKEIYAVGVPSIIMASVGSVMTFGMNTILMAFSSTATAVFGVYFKLQSFVFMPVFGLNNGLVPIVAYNYGARKPDRLMQAVRRASIYAVSMMLLGMAIFQIFPRQLLSIFSASTEMEAIGAVALRVLSLIVSLSRQLLVLLPAAYVLAKIGGLDAVWWSFPIAELVSVTLSIIFFRYVYKKEILPMKNG